MRKTIAWALLIGAFALAAASPAAAHVHHVDNPSHSQNLANGQNHPAFFFDAEAQLFVSCYGANTDLPGTGPAGYGLETAHHGPDEGTPGRADGCFGESFPPTSPAADQNPAIN